MSALTAASDIEVLARFGRALAAPIRCRILLALREAPAYPPNSPMPSPSPALGCRTTSHACGAAAWS